MKMTSIFNSFRLGVLLTLAMVATLLLVITDANSALAQSTATVRVSNLDKPVAGGEIMGFAHTFSQSFCTSNVTATLDQVRLYMSAHSWGTPAPVVSIRSYRSGNLGPVLHTLTNPSIDDSLDTAEDFASSGYELAANTTYWVSVFRPDDSGLIELGKTVSTAEDPATEAGWALGDMMLAKYGARWEERESYALRMAVFATGGAPTMSTPVFSDGGCDQKESYEFSVIENTAADTVVGAVPAREPDGDSLTYSVGGTDAAKFNRVFALNASTGEIVAKSGATVDYESKSSYSLTVSVTDGEDASGSTESEPTTDDTAHVSIRVTNIDEPGRVSLSTTEPRMGRSVRASISDPDGSPKPFRIEWARAFRATSAFIPFLPISGSDMTPESYTPTEEDKYQFLRVTIFYFDNECRRVYLNNDCRRTAEGTFAKAVADEDGLIVQQQVVNTPATGELTLWRGDNPYVPRQLIAYNWSIRDADGMIGSRLRYQWITVDPRTGVETKVYNNNSCQCNPQYTYTLRNVARGKAVMVRARFEDDRGNTEVVASRLTTLVPVVGNTAARGGIGVRGTARVGATLSVHTSSITDADGMEDSEFTYQWLTSEGTYNTSIEGATGSTYVPVASDEGMSIKVRIGFTDDAGYYESFTSGASAAVTAANNPATGAPTISGTVQVGETLTASTTGIADSDGLAFATFTYQWIKLDSNLNDSDISGATGSTYTLVAADAGTGIKVRVSFTDDAGNTESLTNESALIVMAANNPATGAPTISGTAQVGETLTASTTGIADSDGLAFATFTYQWIKLDSSLNDSDISGATGSTYTLVAADAGTGIKVRVSFTDDAGNTESLTSGASAAVTAAKNPATGAPTISGTAQVGETLTASTTGIADSDGLAFATFTYQWIKLDSNLNDSDISGATGSTYTLVAADAGTGIKVRVSFTDDAGNTESLTSGASAAVTAANNPATGAPTISGTARVGETLTASATGIADSDGLAFATFTYQWLADDTDITDATGATYTPAAADAGKAIKVRVSFTDDAGNTESLTSGASAAVTAAQNPASGTARVGETLTANNPATGAPTISGTARVGETLTASATGIADEDGRTNAVFAYHWLADDAAIEGATAATFTLTSSEQGKTVKVRVTFTDDAGNEESVTSDATAAVAATNSPAAGGPVIEGTPAVGQTLTATTSGIGDDDGIATSVFAYQWLADDAAIEGATASTYTLTYGEQGKTIKVTVTFTDDAGNAETLTSAATAAVEQPLTASIENAPDSHDGQSVFTFELRFSEEFGLSYKILRDHAFTVTGGAAIKARRLNPPGNVRWEISVRPSGDGAVTIVLPATTDCASNGAVCTEDGRKLSSALEITVPGREEQQESNSPATGAPTISGRAQVGETLTATTSGIADADGIANAIFTYQWLADDAAIGGATVSTYTVVAGDVGKALKVRVTFTDEAGNDETLTSSATGAVAAANSPATGAPTISGTAQAGETLTADTSGIADSDGLGGVTFAYQWLADDADITDATGSTYTPAAIDAGKAIMVEVSFTDDAGNAETLTSAATAAVTLPPLTASAHGVPASHDGSAAFTFELRFSEEMPLSYKTLRDHAFTATGGEVVKARRLEKGKNLGWEITVQPSGNADVTVALPATTDCSSQGAICTGDGRMLSNELTFTVNGPGG